YELFNTGWYRNAEQSSVTTEAVHMSSCSHSHHIFKTIFNSVSKDILAIANYSLLTGIFPSELKTAMVRPLLKKSNLDSSVLNNFRPISNLPFLSKILEKIVFKQLNNFLDANCAFD